jgi:hypothetical protein
MNAKVDVEEEALLWSLETDATVADGDMSSTDKLAVAVVVAASADTVAVVVDSSATDVEMVCTTDGKSATRRSNSSRRWFKHNLLSADVL